MHEKKNLIETTILALPVVILRKNGAIQYSQSLLHLQTHPLHCMKHSARQQRVLPHCRCAWHVGGAQIFLE